MEALYFSSMLYAFLVDSVVCQYQWACTAPNESGQWYIPSERDRDVGTVTTDGNSLHIYRVPTLDTNCYGSVTAIEYCYRCSTSAGSGQVTFNWTVLILEDAPGNSFVINNTYNVQSRGSMGSANCTSNGDQITCCDRTTIDRFDLSMNFIFGVTESAQENTHGATLLGYHDTLSQYMVATVQLNKAELTLSVGSTVPMRFPVVQRGLRMLWFVVGTTILTVQHTTTASTSVGTTIKSTLKPELPPTTEEFTPIVTSIPITEKQENETTTANITFVATNNPGISVALIGAVIGGVAGSLLVLALLLLLLALVWMMKKYRRLSATNQQEQLEKCDRREAIQQMQHREPDDEAMEMKNNDAYISTTRQIPTEENIAYGQVESDYNLLIDQYEYDYI